MRSRAHLIFVAALLGAWLSTPLAGQSPPGPPREPSPSLELLPSTDPALGAEFAAAIRQRDYRRAERMLVEAAERSPQPGRAAKWYAMAGGLFFLDGQYLNAAIAYKRSARLLPLDERDRFTLALAYIKLRRRDWARAEFERLAAERPRDPLYLYWLARLDYDGQEYDRAIRRFRQVIELDPRMVRAHDNLGLCYDYLGRYEEALASFRRAVELNRQQKPPSPWPHLNMAISLLAMNDLAGAETQLREALGYDGRLPQAHYQLGQVLEKRGRYAEAIVSLERAVQLDPNYPEPYYTLGRIFQRQGRKEEAKRAVERFQQLKRAQEAEPTTTPQTSERFSPD